MSTSARGWLLYAAAWIPFTVVYAFALTAQGETTFSYALLSAFVSMSIAALGGVVVWHLTGRLPVGMNRAVFFSTHLALAGMYALLWSGAQIAWIWLVAGPEVGRYVARQAGAWQVVSGAWIYALIAGISYLIRTQRELRGREVAAAHAEAIAAQAQLRALRAQLNPHFLFNSLHSLGTLVRHEPEVAEEALDRLGELLRYALDHGEHDVVRFRDELAFARNYLELETLRFGDRLCARFEVDDTALDAAVPPFLLQPLVENAIRHGLAPRAGRGAVEVAARLEGERLVLEVRDDGLGAPSAALDHADGLGLRVLRRQLETRYAGRADLEITTAPDAGFHVAVSLPAVLPRRESPPSNGMISVEDRNTARENVLGEDRVPRKERAW